MNQTVSAMFVAGLLLSGLAAGTGDDARHSTAPQPVDHTADLWSWDAENADELVEQYCVRCHNERRRQGDLVLEGLDRSNARLQVGLALIVDDDRRDLPDASRRRFGGLPLRDGRCPLRSGSASIVMKSGSTLIPRDPTRTPGVRPATVTSISARRRTS